MNRLALFLLCGALGGTAVAAEGDLAASQLKAPVQPLSNADLHFIDTMYNAPIIFRGKLFSGYREQCLGDRCDFAGVVFKVIETYEGSLNGYEEGDWQVESDELWRLPADWPGAADVELFNIDDEYLVMGYKDDRGLHITGLRREDKLNRLVMQYELGRIGRQ